MNGTTRKETDIRSASGPQRRWVMLATATLALLGSVQTAHAGSLDLRLDKFFKGTTSTNQQRADQDNYKQLMREVSLAVGPRMGGPAASGGPLGLDAAYEMSFIGIKNNNEYWQRAAENPEPVVHSGQLRVRKGLPHQLQLGTVLTNLNDSDLWAIGAELGLSLIDGFKYIPELGTRVSIHTVLGNSDIDMFIVGADFSLSKSIGIAGLFALEPWLGYSGTFTHVSTHQLLVFADDKAIRPEAVNVKEFGAPGALSDAITNRGAFGVRAVVTRMQFGLELMRSFTDDLNVVTARAGVEF